MMISKLKPLVKTFSSTAGSEESKLRIYGLGPDVVIERETIMGVRREGVVSFTRVHAGAVSEIAALVAEDTNQHLSLRGTEFLTGSSWKGSFVGNAKQLPTARHGLSGISGEADLSRMILQMIEPIGGHAFFAMHVSVDAETRQPRQYVVLASGDRGYLQRYVEKRWFAIDPFLIHGATSNAPMYSSHIGLLENLTGSWRDMGVGAREHGLCSWAGFPTHRPGSHDFGVLYVASPTLPADGGERLFQENSIFLRGLAAEVFDWQLALRKAQILKGHGFSTTDLQVLKAVAEGTTARQIAVMQNISEREVRKRVFPSIVSKARAKNIREAARYASERGLLPILSGKKVLHVAASRRYGVYLGALYGAPFWSKVNPSGIPDAVGFATETEAREVLRSLGGPDDLELLRVEVDQSADTVAEDVCIAAGLPGWNDGNVLLSGAPADNSATPGSLDGKPATYH